jgi:hypothetical protein
MFQNDHPRAVGSTYSCRVRERTDVSMFHPLVSVRSRTRLLYFKPTVLCFFNNKTIFQNDHPRAVGSTYSCRVRERTDIKYSQFFP